MFRHEIRVKKINLFLLCAMAVTVGCERRTSGTTAPTPTTQTIAPAAGKPAPPGTDVMTQTVEVEDSRSDAEGGVLTKKQTTTRTSTAAAPKKKKK
jgi:hypothetical protein